MFEEIRRKLPSHWLRDLAEVRGLLDRYQVYASYILAHSGRNSYIDCSEDFFDYLSIIPYSYEGNYSLDLTRYSTRSIINGSYNEIDRRNLNKFKLKLRCEPTLPTSERVSNLGEEFEELQSLRIPFRKIITLFGWSEEDILCSGERIIDPHQIDRLDLSGYALTNKFFYDFNGKLMGREKDDETQCIESLVAECVSRNHPVGF